jgi:hypothetical protein
MKQNNWIYGFIQVYLFLMLIFDGSQVINVFNQYI